MKLPHPIPYQGSKRNLADQILKLFPKEFDRLIEPFAGSAAITIATANTYKSAQLLINDINLPLINLWRNIVNSPEAVAKAYSDIWHGQTGNGEQHYYDIRSKFNDTQTPEYLLFLLAKCVKAAVRYSAQGNFNQSPDKRRLGKKPKSMGEDISRVSSLLKGRIEFHSEDYQNVLDLATDRDLVYMDPPYQGTGKNGGFNYAGNIDFQKFIEVLHKLNERNVPFILSFDGRTGDKTYGEPLPESLNLTKIEINAGRSSQATLLQKDEITFEAVYLSPNLYTRVGTGKPVKAKAIQTELMLM